MKTFLRFCVGLLLCGFVAVSCFSQEVRTIRGEANSVRVLFERPDGVFVSYKLVDFEFETNGLFAKSLRCSAMTLSDFFVAPQTFFTLNEARRSIGLGDIVDEKKDEKPPSDEMGLLNGTDDWRRFCPIQIAETYVRKTECVGDCFVYYHSTHSILMSQTLANQGKESKCNLKVQGVNSGIVYVETTQKMGAIRNDMTGFNQFGNNHPMNVYGVGLARDCAIKLPKNEPLRFTWTNVGDVSIEVWLHHPNPNPNKNVNFRECLEKNNSRSFEYDAMHFADLPAWQTDLKSNNNGMPECNNF
jgi:hypothetical protein